MRASSRTSSSSRALLSDILGAVGARVALVARPSRPQVSTLDFSIDDLGQTFDGYTIAVISDLHHPPTNDVSWLHNVVNEINSAAPDLIVLLGDYAWSFRRMRSLSRPWYGIALNAVTSACRQLRARDGIIAVLGNHDYYAGVEAVRDWLARIDADVLVNRARLIRRGTDALCITGLDDARNGQPDPFAGRETSEGFPTVMLAHNPDSIMHVAEDVRVDVMLAGHTHGGQIVLPWYGAPRTMAHVCGRRTASGWIPHERAPLYVTRGIGVQLPVPIRVNCPPELLLLRLQAGRQHPA